MLELKEEEGGIALENHHYRGFHRLKTEYNGGVKNKA